MDQQNQKHGSEILSPQEIRRYSLQINNSSLGVEGQEKIKRAKVLVVGAGGKGSALMQIMAAIGVGVIGISDNFPVQEADLSRQHLYGNNDLGKQKAIISRQKLIQINHFVEYKLHNVCLSEQNITTICSNYDILIDATDNFTTHYLLNDAAIRLNKPLIYGDVIQSKGIISVFNYHEGPSLRCAFPSPVKTGEMDEKKGFVCHVAVMNIVGSFMANEVVKVILGHDSELSGNLLTFDLKNNSIDFKMVKRNPAHFSRG